MGRPEIIHDHSFDTSSAEKLLEDFEKCIKDKVFVACYGLEKKMKDIAPPADYKGWRVNCFDTYNVSDEFNNNDGKLEIRNDQVHFDFSIGKKALSDMSEVSDFGKWSQLLLAVEESAKVKNPENDFLYQHRKKVYEQMVLPFKLKKTIYFPFEAFDFEAFLKLGIDKAIQLYKEKQDIVILELDSKPLYKDKYSELTSILLVDNYTDFRKI